jgi:hypothetical protein
LLGGLFLNGTGNGLFETAVDGNKWRHRGNPSAGCLGLSDTRAAWENCRPSTPSEDEGRVGANERV